jgi:integrase
MAATKITKRFVDSVKATGKSQTFFDSELTGLYLRVSADGATKSYGIKFRNRAHVQRRMKIGTHGAVTPEQAREIAARMLAENAQGSDPVARTKAYREAWTVADLAEFYQKEVLPAKRPKTRASYTDSIARFIVPMLGKRKLQEVTHADVTRFHRSATAVGKHDREGKQSTTGQTQANRTVRVLSSMFTTALREGHVTANPCRGVKLHPEGKRERFLSGDELGRLLIACDQHPDQNAANYVRLLAFTGARPGETLAAEWRMFDLEAATWTKPSQHTKQKKTHVVPLAATSVALLTAMREAADDAGGAVAACPYLFPTRDLSKPRADVKAAWGQIVKAAGLADVTRHTLRHTFASQLVQAKETLPQVGRLLGHTQAATTHRYAHLAVDSLREATGTFDRIATAGKTKALEMQKREAAKVVNIASARR